MIKQVSKVSKVSKIRIGDEGRMMNTTMNPAEWLHRLESADAALQHAQNALHAARLRHLDIASLETYRMALRAAEDHLELILRGLHGAGYSRRSVERAAQLGAKQAQQTDCS